MELGIVNVIWHLLGMSLKGSTTTSDYIDFDTVIKVGKKLLANSKSERFGLLIIVAANTGLRISDIRHLSWKDLREEEISLNEKKTGKHKVIPINETVRNAVSKFDSEADSAFAFTSQKGSVYSIQQVNRRLKSAFRKQALQGLNISTHSLRKSFGRRVFVLNDESEKALIYLSELFNHTSPSITRKYLGIRNEELAKLYLDL